MTKTIIVCDVCEKETKDMYVDRWFQVEKLKLWHGLGKSGVGDRFNFDCGDDTNNAIHCCSIKCLTQWLRSAVKGYFDGQKGKE